MTLTEYQQLAARTCSDLGGKSKNLLHMRLGVITEFGEALDMIKKHLAYGKPLDLVNIQEEISDIMWYLVNQLRIIEQKIGEINPKHFNIDEIEYNEDAVKVLAYNLESILTAYLTGDEINDIIDDLYVVSVENGFDFFKGLENNINKLKVRFPDKFDAEKALNRNLDAERIELEK